MIRKLTSAALLAAFVFILGGCTATSISMNFVAIEPVNERQPGESRNVDVRIYQLRDSANFEKATVDELWENAQAILADHFINVKLGESIFPEKADKAQGRVVVVEPLSSECRFVGILALYETATDKGEQKVVVPVAEAGSVTFELTGKQIVVKK